MLGLITLFLFTMALGCTGANSSDNSETTGKPVLQWSAAFSANDYFKYSNNLENSGVASSSDKSLANVPWAFTNTPEELWMILQQLCK